MLLSSLMDENFLGELTNISRPRLDEVFSVHNEMDRAWEKEPYHLALPDADAEIADYLSRPSIPLDESVERFATLNLDKPEGFPSLISDTLVEPDPQKSITGYQKLGQTSSGHPGIFFQFVPVPMFAKGCNASYRDPGPSIFSGARNVFPTIALSPPLEAGPGVPASESLQGDRSQIQRRLVENNGACCCKICRNEFATADAFREHLSGCSRDGYGNKSNITNQAIKRSQRKRLSRRSTE